MASATKSISPEQVTLDFTFQPRIQRLKKSMAQRISDAANETWPKFERAATPDPRKRKLKIHIPDSRRKEKTDA